MIYTLLLQKVKRCGMKMEKVSYQKHKIFLYKEDFDKFKDGLDDVLNKIAEIKNEE